MSQDLWMVDQVDQATCLLQMEWVICILTWMTQERITLQKDLLREILDQRQGICRQICLHLLMIQMMAVR